MDTTMNMDIYKRYLNNFEDTFGKLDFDQVAQHKGQLIRKMRYDEFLSKHKECRQIEEYLRDVMSRGATLNDEVNINYKELCAHLLESPKDFLTI